VLPARASGAAVRLLVDFVVTRSRLGTHKLVDAVLAVFDAIAALRVCYEASVEALELSVVQASARAVMAVGFRPNKNGGHEGHEHSSLHLIQSLKCCASLSPQNNRRDV